MTNKIRVSFPFFNITDTDSLLTILNIKNIPIADKIVLDNESPDYVIASDDIYYRPKFEAPFRKVLKDNNRSPIRIAFLREAMSPDLNIFDYAICWNWKLSYLDRVARIPPHYFIGNSLTYMLEMNNKMTQAEAKKILERKERRFCSFMYSNSYAHHMRDDLFHALSDYKRVDSLGIHLNNVGTMIKGSGDWQQVSIQVKSHYKFSIACENATFDGYTSEKLLTSFCANTVPIYWGNPYVAEEYNPEAFINCNDYDSIDGIIKRVKEIDENDDLWAYMVSQPWQTEAQKNYSDQEFRNYQQFMTNIFSQPLDKARRRPSGTWPSMFYKNWFLKREFSADERIFTRIKRLIKHPRRIFYKFRRAVLPRTDIDEFFKN